MVTRFAHMLPAESELWENFLRKWGSGWDNYEYDVHVGEGLKIGPEYDVMTQGIAMSLTQKRIDVVARRQGVLWIFEIKQQAAISALGQVIAYRELYRKTFGYGDPIELGIVTDAVQEDDRFVYDKFGVHVYLVEPYRW